MDSFDYRKAALFAVGITIIAAVVWAMSAQAAEATWKPEYGKNDPEVLAWFKTRKLMPAAHKRLQYTDCCNQAERLMTKVIPAKNKYGEDGWSYYVDPKCTHAGCRLMPIPDDTIHDDPIPPGPAFRQLRAEGILFIYEGVVTCFWKPQDGD